MRLDRFCWSFLTCTFREGLTSEGAHACCKTLWHVRDVIRLQLLCIVFMPWYVRIHAVTLPEEFVSNFELLHAYCKGLDIRTRCILVRTRETYLKSLHDLGSAWGHCLKQRTAISLWIGAHTPDNGFDLLIRRHPSPRVVQTIETPHTHAGEGQKEPSRFTQIPETGWELPDPQIIRQGKLRHSRLLSRECTMTRSTHWHLLLRHRHAVLSHLKCFSVQQPRLPIERRVDRGSFQLCHWDSFGSILSIFVIARKSPSISIPLRRK